MEDEKTESRRQEEAKAEARRLEAEKLAKERFEKERLEKERMEKERLEKERLEKERLETERLEKERVEKNKFADLERRLAEAEKARIEAERLAERACRMEQQLSKERRFSTPFLQTSETIDPKCNSSSERRSYSDPKNECHNSNGTKTGHHQRPSSEMNQTGTMVCNKEVNGHYTQDMSGSNIGYQRYLSTFHVDDDGSSGGEHMEDTTVPSESLEGSGPTRFAPVLQADMNRPTTAPISKQPEMRGSKIKRSVSTRSLTFTNIDATEEASSDKETPPREDSKLTSDKILSLQRITSIESVNLDDPIYMYSFLMKPCPKGLGMIQCCIRRNKGIKNALFPEYRMYLKSSDGKSETFLMTSKKRGKMLPFIAFRPSH